ncbi:Myo9 [Bugula neritina]|uniref:Myo9 n=1 Tax=Bugula neritina TaxID=10212 RepID=A0A7J7JYR9_BUGNE|nr:Myo9 [Bugula neritina]
MSLPLVNTTAPEIRSKEVFAKSPVIAKLPVRRTSSNDPEILRRASSRTDKSSPGASGLLSPEDAVSPTDRTISRQGSHASSVEFDDTAIKFTRTHILRKNVQVRKSQSADNLAPFTVSGPSKEHDIDLKQPSVINGRHMSTVKSQSFDHLSKKEHFEDGKVLGVSNLPGNKVRSKEMVDSDDSDLLSGSFYKVPAPVPHDTPVEKKRGDLLIV